MLYTYKIFHLNLVLAILHKNIKIFYSLNVNKSSRRANMSVCKYGSGKYNPPTDGIKQTKLLFFFFFPFVLNIENSPDPIFKPTYLHIQWESLIFSILPIFSTSRSSFMFCTTRPRGVLRSGTLSESLEYTYFQDPEI